MSCCSKAVSRALISLAVGVAVSILILMSPVHASGQVTPSAKLSIAVTEAPHAGKGGPDQTEPISGEVRGVDYGTHKVVIYAFGGGTWYVQPTVAVPLTDIDQSGRWQTITHLGSTYAALLVNQSYKPPAIMTTVPRVGADVLAVTLAAGRK
jgi:hypothetical protein